MKTPNPRSGVVIFLIAAAVGFWEEKEEGRKKKEESGVHGEERRGELQPQCCPLVVPFSSLIPANTEDPCLHSDACDL